MRHHDTEVAATDITKLKSDAAAFKDVRRNGLISITLKDDDSLIAAMFVGKSDEVSLITQTGQSIRFKESDVRQMGRTAAGVAAMKINKKGDCIVSAAVLKEADADREILIVTENGYGKRTKLEEDGEAIYRITNRGGKGVKTLNITEKTGSLISINAVSDNDDLMIINKSGLTIRMAVEDLRVMGRATQGVKLINLKGNDSIAAVTKVMKDDEEEEIEIDEDGNVISKSVIEKVKPVLEILEDDEIVEDDDEDEDEVIEDEEIDEEEDENEE